MYNHTDKVLMNKIMFENFRHQKKKKKNNKNNANTALIIYGNEESMKMFILLLVVCFLKTGMRKWRTNVTQNNSEVTQTN